MKALGMCFKKKKVQKRKPGKNKDQNVEVEFEKQSLENYPNMPTMI